MLQKLRQGAGGGGGMGGMQEMMRAMMGGSVSDEEMAEMQSMLKQRQLSFTRKLTV